MISNIIDDIRLRMEKCIETFKTKINGLQTRRASPNLLNNIMINYYGRLTPIYKLANITIESINVLKISIFDLSIKSDIEKSIMKSKLDLHPDSTDKDIRVQIPLFTEERRKNLI